jgi:hypothetical protein
MAMNKSVVSSLSKVKNAFTVVCMAERDGGSAPGGKGRLGMPIR